MRLCHVIYIVFKEKANRWPCLLAVISVENIETRPLSLRPFIAQGQITEGLQTPIPSVFFGMPPHHPSLIGCPKVLGSLRGCSKSYITVTGK